MSRHSFRTRPFHRRGRYLGRFAGARSSSWFTRVAAKRIITSPYRSQISSFVTANVTTGSESAAVPQFVDIEVRTLLCSSLASDGAGRGRVGVMAVKSQPDQVEEPARRIARSCSDCKPLHGPGTICKAMKVADA